MRLASLLNQRMNRMLINSMHIVGMYACGPLSGRIVDRRGPRPLFVYAFLSLFIGYAGIYQIYVSEPSSSQMVVVGLLSFLSFLTGSGGNAGFCAAVNATAKSYPDHAVGMRPVPFKSQS